jgi:CBS domain-containing protein
MSSWLSTIPASAIVGSHASLVTIHENDTVEMALKALAAKHIYCAPVVDAQNKPLGLLSLGDLIYFLVSLFATSEHIVLGRGMDTVNDFRNKNFSPSHVEHIRHKFFAEPAKKIANFSKENAFHPVPVQGTTLAELTHLLAQPHIHRLVMTDATGNMCAIVSQSTLAGFFNQEHEPLKALKQQTVAQAATYTHPLQTIPPDMRAIDAFALLAEFKIGAVAYLLDNGQVHGNISQQDISGVLHGFAQLALPTIDYVNRIRNETVRDIVPLVVIHPSDTLGKALAKLAAVGVHRLYVTPDSGTGAPLGMLTLRDVLRAVVNFNKA